MDRQTAIERVRQLLANDALDDDDAKALRVLIAEARPLRPDAYAVRIEVELHPERPAYEASVYQDRDSEVSSFYQGDSLAAVLGQIGQDVEEAIT